MIVKEAVAYHSHGQHGAVYISLVDSCDQAKGMDLLAYASKARGDHNSEQARSSEIKRGDPERCVPRISTGKIDAWTTFISWNEDPESV